MDGSGGPDTSSIPVSFTILTSKPSAKLSYSFIPAKGSNSLQPLIVFLNGLGLPASSWRSTISLLVSHLPHPPVLSYDRYGQGLSDRDPLDAAAADPAHGHDCMDAVRDLHQLISQVCSENSLEISKESENGAETVNPGIFFVANSLGCAIARLYADTYPNTVSGLVFLDSVMANSDFISIWPDPDAPGFAETYLPLPDGVSEDALKETRAKYRKLLHPVTGIMGNAEGLSRKNLAELLPHADRPVLRFGTNGKGPWLTVVGHGFDTFAAEGLKNMGTPVAITQNYTNPYWNRYNEGLAKLTSPERSKGPIQALRCGHFIQRDDPEFVVGEILELLSAQKAPISQDRGSA